MKVEIIEISADDLTNLRRGTTGRGGGLGRRDCSRVKTSLADGLLAPSNDARGLPTAKNERRSYAHVWQPAVGRLALDAVKASHIQSVINDAAAGRLLTVKGKRYSRESITQMRATILRMLESAWKEEVLTENGAKRTEVPEIEETKKPRAVMTDTEIGQLLAHPHVDAELKLVVLLSDSAI